MRRTVLNVMLIIWNISITVNKTKAASIHNNYTTECNDWYLFNDFCYKVFTHEEYYRDAESICKSSGSKVVSISSSNENNYVQAITAKHTEYREVWIGLKRSRGVFQWMDGHKTKYQNWLISKPRGTGDCVRMILSGHWANLLCYQRLPFVCKREKNPPADSSNLALILNITIPLSCIFIMSIFVAYLCYRSYKELSDIQADIVDGKPFEIIQAAMILPMKKAPDLLNSNKGKNLWKGAIEKLKAEQIRNNPFNDPGNFLKRATSSEAVSSSAKNNNNLEESQDGATLADIVNSLLKKRRETVTTGMLGAPTSMFIKVPNISVNRCSPTELDTDAELNKNNNNIHNENIHSSNTSSSSSSSSRSQESYIYLTGGNPQIYESKVDILLTNQKPLKKSKKQDDINYSNYSQSSDSEDQNPPVFPKKHMERSEREKHSICKHDINSQNRKHSKSCCGDKSDECNSSSKPGSKNLVKVVVDINKKPTNRLPPKYNSSYPTIHLNKNDLKNNNSIVNIQQGETPNLTSQHKNLDLIQSESQTKEKESSENISDDEDDENTNICPFKRSYRANNNTCGSISSNNNSSINERHNGVFDRQSFRDSVRRESQKRKERYYPSSSSDACERDFSEVSLPPLIHQNNYAADYAQVTLV